MARDIFWTRWNGAFQRIRNSHAHFCAWKSEPGRSHSRSPTSDAARPLSGCTWPGHFLRWAEGGAGGRCGIRHPVARMIGHKKLAGLIQIGPTEQLGFPRDAIKERLLQRG